MQGLCYPQSLNRRTRFLSDQLSSQPLNKPTTFTSKYESMTHFSKLHTQTSAFMQNTVSFCYPYHAHLGKVCHKKAGTCTGQFKYQILKFLAKLFQRYNRWSKM